MSVDADRYDPAELAAGLIRCETVTPDAGPALDYLEEVLARAGFETHRLVFSAPATPDVDNLFARFGSGVPHLCFAGHVDVVPPGDEDQWSHGPFSGDTEDGLLYGRGAVDMKGGVACFAAAALQHVRQDDTFSGSISFLITGDEEGPAVNGTRKVLDWMRDNNHIPDHCLLGEPTNPQALGDAVKIGRRGSLNGKLTVTGVQGHAAYPQLAQNPLPRLIAMLDALTAEPLDDGSAHFQPSNLEITSIDTGNEAVNIIPRSATALFNIRFNDHHSCASLKKRITDECEKISDEMGGSFELDFHETGEWFLAPQDGFAETVAGAIEKITGRSPELSTSGGTSDGRFIKNFCPVVEFGLVGQTMHKIDECVALDDLNRLTEIYREVIARYFSPASS